MTHGREVVYDNPWIRVEHHDVTTPGGTSGIYGLVHFKNRAVGIIPIDDDDHTWLVGQYRYTLDEYSWEMPSGGSPVGEDLDVTAIRELAEETGLVAGSLELLFGGVRLTNSVTDESAWCYVARDLTLGEPNPEASEQLELRRLPVDDAIAMALSGEINDAFTHLGLLHLHVLRTSGGDPR